MSETMLKRFKRLYNDGNISLSAIQSMLDAGKITEEEYATIVSTTE